MSITPRFEECPTTSALASLRGPPPASAQSTLPFHVLAWLLVCLLASMAGWFIWQGDASRRPQPRVTKQQADAEVPTSDHSSPAGITALDVPLLLQVVGNDWERP